MMEFLLMGGYAAFVWPSYAIALVAVLGLGLYHHHKQQKLRQELQRLEAQWQQAKQQESQE